MPRRKRLTPQKRQPRKSTIPDIPDDLWHEIKGILDERRRRGRTEYLVDWEPNAVTGQTYDPSWQIEVTGDALEEWEARNVGVVASSSVSPYNLREVEPESQESQPPRPANWRSLERSSAAQLNKRKQVDTPERLETTCKKQRLDRTVSPFDGPAPSTTTASSAVSLSGSPQPSQQVYSISEAGQQVAVVLEKNPDFDPTDFHSVIGTNTQSTGLSSQSLSQLESQDSQFIVAGIAHDSRQTVPDSQDLFDSSLSQPQLSAHLSSSHAPSQRVIADSQAESQALIDSYSTSAHLDTATQVQALDKVSGRPATQIPSGQGLTQSPGTSFDRLRASIGPAPSDQLPVTYESQPPFTPFPESPTTASHLATGTPSQLAAFILQGHRDPGQQPSSQCSQKQTLISSQLSEAAQIIRGGFQCSFDKDALTQSTPNSLDPVEPGGSPASRVPQQAQSQAPRIKTRATNCVLAMPPPSTMDSAQGTHGTSSRPSAEEELNKILDISAAGPASKPRPSVQAELDKVFRFDIDASAPLPSVPGFTEDNELGNQAASSNEPATFTQAELTIQSQPRNVEDTSTAPINPHFDHVTLPLSTGHDLSTAYPDTGTSGTLRGDMHTDVLLPGTVSPADILRSTEGIVAVPLPSLGEAPFHSAVDFDSSRQPPPMGQNDTEVDQETSIDSVLGGESRDELITLPFQASARDEYMSRLVSYRDAIQQYSRHFDEDDTEDPSPSLVGQIDDLFRALQNICDFPPDLIGTSLEELDAKGKTKYARDANGKFSFIYELLQGITVDTKVLIVARSTELLRLLFYVTEALEIDCVCAALEAHESAFKESAAVVRLALPTEHVSPNNYDVVVGFDNSLASSSWSTRTETSTTRTPLILRLVTTHGMDHIDYKVDHDIVPLERRQAILYAIVGGRHLVSEPERGQQEPHEIAKAFYDYLNGETDEPDWVPVPLPDSLLMSYLGSQGQPAIPAVNQPELDNGLKRKFDEEDDEEAKRLKTAAELDLTMSNQDPPVPEEVLNMLDAISPGDDVLATRPATVSIHLVMLELLAQQLAEHERQRNSTQLDEATKAVIESQAKQLKSYKRSFDGIYTKYRTALSDRQLFEKNMLAAEQGLRDTEKKAEKKIEKLEQRIAALEADKMRLLGTNEGAEGGETPLATNEKLLKEAQEKVNVLEKRLVNAQQESEYIREQYRNAQGAAGETGQLRTQLKKAEEEAGRNKVRIHEINVANSVRGYLSRISELETQLRERDTELDRAREELRVSKNGRRETRQTSVPRSPRMGMLSPRAPVRSYPNSTSRGGSPAPVGIDVGNVAGGSLLPGMQLLPQTPANGRWNQL